MLEGTIAAALILAIVGIGYAIKLRRAMKLPTDVLEEIVSHAEFLEMDIIQREEARKRMTPEDRKSVRAAEMVYGQWERKLPRQDPDGANTLDVDALREILKARRR